MSGYALWIARDGRFTMIDAFISEFDRAETAALEHVGGGKVDSYTRGSAEWMRKLYREPGTVKIVIDANLIPPRGEVKRGGPTDRKPARRTLKAAVSSNRR